MVFFLLATVIMAVSTVLLYKATQYLGLKVDRWALVMCAVFALCVNFASIFVSIHMTLNYVLVIAGFVLAAAAAVTGFNEYRIRRTLAAEESEDEVLEADEEAAAPPSQAESVEESAPEEVEPSAEEAETSAEESAAEAETEAEQDTE